MKDFYSQFDLSNFVKMIQQGILLLLFSGAAFYLGRMIYKSFQAKNSCATGCGKCDAAHRILKNES